MARDTQTRIQSSEEIRETSESPIGTGGGTLQWPSDHEASSGMWLTFTRKKYSRATRNAFGTATPVGNTIALPMPQSFAARYGANWDNEDFGAALRVLGEGAATTLAESEVTSVYEGLKVAGASAFENRSNIATSYLADVVKGNSTAQKIGSYIGVARNPHQAFLYRGPAFRSFDFNYKLSSKNRQEADTIRAIIKEFKVAMSPDFSEVMENNLFKYPDVFEIQALKSQHLFKIAECALRNVSVDYHGEGVPYYHTDKIPASLTLNLSFQEMRILVREDIEQGY